MKVVIIEFLTIRFDIICMFLKFFIYVENQKANIKWGHSGNEISNSWVYHFSIDNPENPPIFIYRQQINANE